MFTLGGISFEYDALENQKNIEKHGISFKSAVRVFWDYDRIEFYDEENSMVEDRYDTIGDLSAGTARLSAVKGETTIGSVSNGLNGKEDVLFVVYTERVRVGGDGMKKDITRLISARYATSFERGLYYGKY
ncbi:MAG: BrnT family toxin [Lachnospiraceae bacterium]|nr:BrnT family toxin [Lachnospiraceae bacterium]